jgi:hypothetical protein
MFSLEPSITSNASIAERDLCSNLPNSTLRERDYVAQLRGTKTKQKIRFRFKNLNFRRDWKFSVQRRKIRLAVVQNSIIRPKVLFGFLFIRNDFGSSSAS